MRHLKQFLSETPFTSCEFCETLQEHGILPTLGFYAFFTLILLIILPFFLLGLPFKCFNDWSKGWV